MPLIVVSLPAAQVCGRGIFSLNTLVFPQSPVVMKFAVFPVNCMYDSKRWRQYQPLAEHVGSIYCYAARCNGGR